MMVSIIKSIFVLLLFLMTVFLIGVLIYQHDHYKVQKLPVKDGELEYLYQELSGIHEIYEAGWNVDGGSYCFHRKFHWTEYRASAEPHGSFATNDNPYRFKAINNTFGEWQKAPMLKRTNGIRANGRTFVGNVDSCVGKSKKWKSETILEKAQAKAPNNIWYIDNGAYFAIMDMSEKYVEKLVFSF